MNLAMTELSDAWRSPTRAPIESPIKKTLSQVQAHNSKSEYDEFIINVDTFKPFRIDVSIKNQALIDRLKTMTTSEQTTLITKLLSDYFEQVPIHTIEYNERIQMPNSTEMEISIPNSTPVERKTEMQMLIPNSTPTDVSYLQNDPRQIAQIEYMRSSSSTGNDDTVLLVILLLCIWIVLDRIAQIV
jgi:hypothetical protein